jgi:hypothetical protein
MKGREIPPFVGWITAALILVIAGYTIWRATGPSMVTGGNPTDRDRELLRGMQEAREKTRAGRGGPASTPPNNAPQTPTNK